MRLLFMHHLPPQASPNGRLARHWAGALANAGHEVRLLVVGSQPTADDPLVSDTITARAGDDSADLPFAAPQFGALAEAGQPTFALLSEEHLDRYRDQLRRRLDVQIDQFNPDVVHAQYIWLDGQLALESGVPFVISAWGPELSEYQREERYRALAEQAAENAGRIIVPDESLAAQVIHTFDGVRDRVMVMPAELRLSDSGATAQEQAAAAEALVRIYQAVLDERFGR